VTASKPEAGVRARDNDILAFKGRFGIGGRRPFLPEEQEEACHHMLSVGSFVEIECGRRAVD